MRADFSCLLFLSFFFLDKKEACQIPLASPFLKGEWIPSGMGGACIVNSVVLLSVSSLSPANLAGKFISNVQGLERLHARFSTFITIGCNACL
jgi:hypothetical protein